MSSETKQAVVAGGSLAGLMNAIVLRNLGYSVRVLERRDDAALQSEAAGIRAGPEVHTFIETYIKDYPEYAIRMPGIDIVDEKGDVVTQLPVTEPMRMTTWKILYDLFLGALMDTRDSKPAATYENHTSVEDISYDGSKVSVTYRSTENATTSTVFADVLIAADGANSTVRKKVLGNISPQYSGYVTWRGRLREAALTARTRDALRNRCMVHRARGGYGYFISYHVPGDTIDGATKPCEFVWIWYDVIPEDSQEFNDTMTDADGKKHFTTIPRGKMQPKVWNGILNKIKNMPNPYFNELLERTEEPFVSAIRDFPGEKSVFYDGKLLLVGDAFSLCRTHAGMSTSQAAFQALGLAKVFEGAMALEKWEEECLEGARKAQAASMQMANYYFSWNRTDLEGQSGYLVVK